MIIFCHLSQLKHISPMYDFISQSDLGRLYWSFIVVFLILIRFTMQGKDPGACLVANPPQNTDWPAITDLDSFVALYGIHLTRTDC